MNRSSLAGFDPLGDNVAEAFRNVAKPFRNVAKPFRNIAKRRFKVKNPFFRVEKPWLSGFKTDWLPKMDIAVDAHALAVP